MASTKSKKSAIIKTCLIVVIVAIICAIGRFALQSIDKSSSVKTFEDCQKSPGSIDQQSYPEVCVTKDGQRFVQPVTAPNQTAVPQ